MGPVGKAILEGDSELVWSLLSATARSNHDTGDTEDLDDLLELALRKGILASVIPLLSQGARSPRWTPTELLVVDYFRELSSHWAAGWLADIEYHAYGTATGAVPDPTWPYPLSERQIDDLQMLSAEFDGWAAWVGSGPRFVALTEWEPLYERWRRTR